jgi:hypothetical protein
MTRQTDSGARSQPAPDEVSGRWSVVQIEEALRGLQYGQVIVTVQDGVVVQVERTERKRFQRSTPNR